jgi:hypothetical protein
MEATGVDDGESIWKELYLYGCAACESAQVSVHQAIYYGLPQSRDRILPFSSTPDPVDHRPALHIPLQHTKYRFDHEWDRTVDASLIQKTLASRASLPHPWCWVGNERES